jgi:hypothetical protein
MSESGQLGGTDSGNQPAAGAPQPMSAVEGEKLRIELQKLRLEIADLSRWRAKMLLGLLSAFLSPLIAVGTYIVGLHSSQASARIQTDNAQYSEIAKDIGDADVGARLSATFSIRRFILRPLESSRWRSQEEADADGRRAQNAISLLVARLGTEEDPDVANSIIDAVLLRPDIALPLLLDANRRAASDFARAAGEYYGLRLLKTRKVSEKDVEQDIQLDVLRASRLFDEARELNTSFHSRRFLYSQPYRAIFLKQQKYSTGEGLSEKPPVPTSDEIGKAENEMLQSAQFLEASSRALATILKQRSQVAEQRKAGTPQGEAGQLEDWSGAVIVVGEFPNPAYFSGLDLSGSYLFAASALSRVVLSGATIKNADFTGLHFNSAEFEDAAYKGLELCPDWSTYAPDTRIDPKQISLVNKDDPRCSP